MDSSLHFLDREQCDRLGSFQSSLRKSTARSPADKLADVARLFSTCVRPIAGRSSGDARRHPRRSLRLAGPVDERGMAMRPPDDRRRAATAGFNFCDLAYDRWPLVASGSPGPRAGVVRRLLPADGTMTLGRATSRSWAAGSCGGRLRVAYPGPLEVGKPPRPPADLRSGTYRRGVASDGLKTKTPREQARGDVDDGRTSLITPRPAPSVCPPSSPARRVRPCAGRSERTR